jgi:hypothetical protein
MDAMKMVAVVLIVGGVLALAYGSFTYTKETHDGKIGPIELSVKDKETVNIRLGRRRLDRSRRRAAGLRTREAVAPAIGGGQRPVALRAKPHGPKRGKARAGSQPACAPSRGTIEEEIDHVAGPASSSSGVIAMPNPSARRCGSEMTICRNNSAANSGFSRRRLPANFRVEDAGDQPYPFRVGPCSVATAANSGSAPIPRRSTGGVRWPAPIRRRAG